MNHLFLVGGEGEAERAKSICIKSISIRSTIASRFHSDLSLTQISLPPGNIYYFIYLSPVTVTSVAHTAVLSLSSSNAYQSLYPFPPGGHDPYGISCHSFIIFYSQHCL